MNPTDTNFAYKIRHALNEQAEALPPTTINRLIQARKTALAHKKTSSADLLTVAFAQNPFFGSAGALSGRPFSWLGRLGVAAPLILGVALLIGIHHTTQQQRINELAEVDIAVLSDELPLLAYLDNGFNAYLAGRAE